MALRRFSSFASTGVGPRRVPPISTRWSRRRGRDICGRQRPSPKPLQSGSWPAPAPQPGCARHRGCPESCAPTTKPPSMVVARLTLVPNSYRTRAFGLRTAPLERCAGKPDSPHPWRCSRPRARAGNRSCPWSSVPVPVGGRPARAPQARCRAAGLRGSSADAGAGRAVPGRCQRRLRNPQKCRSKIPHFGGSGDRPGQGSAAPFFSFGGRPLRFGGGGGMIGALARTCSGIRSAWARSR